MEAFGTDKKDFERSMRHVWIGRNYEHNTDIKREGERERENDRRRRYYQATLHFQREKREAISPECFA